MKNITLVINVVLIVAVAILFFKVYKNPAKNETIKSSNQSITTNLKQNGSIAFVELDSLNEQITYIKARRQELEAEQKAIETEWQGGYKNLENRKNQFIKRGASITQEEAEKFQGELMQQQQQIDQKKQNLSQNLSEKSYKLMDDIQKKLKDFLADYNKNKNYQYILTTGTGLDYMLYKDSSFNITNDVIAGMNELMKAKK